MNQQDNTNLAKRMDGFERELTKIQTSIEKGFLALQSEVASLKEDNAFLTEGNKKHRVPPIREEVALVKDIAYRANRRIDHILWLVAGISLGSGIGGAVIVKILFGI